MPIDNPGVSTGLTRVVTCRTPLTAFWRAGWRGGRGRGRARRRVMCRVLPVSSTPKGPEGTRRDPKGGVLALFYALSGSDASEFGHGHIPTRVDRHTSTVVPSAGQQGTENKICTGYIYVYMMYTYLYLYLLRSTLYPTRAPRVFTVVFFCAGISERRRDIYMKTKTGTR